MSRQATVLFADVSGSTRLYETAGDARAVEAIARCLGVLRNTVEAGGGRVVKTMGDEIMALFATPDEAASASVKMHISVEALPPVGTHKLAVRIGFHAGPVIQRDNDVFGDTVNMASRLVAQAMKGQVLTCEETASRLSPAIQNAVRRLYFIQLKGKAEKIELCELVWRQSPDVTATATNSTMKARSMRLRLRYAGREISERRRNLSIMVGREEDCQLVIADPKASRQHCTIERRQDQFVLQDHSANGTFITVEGDKEILLQREDFVLRNHGWIAFGQPRADTSCVVEYFCE